MEWILDNLAIGNYKEAKNHPHGVNAMLSVAEERQLDDPDFLFHQVPITDMQPIPLGQLDEATRWIAEQIENHRILVFCNAGIGRSASVIVAYLSIYKDIAFGEAVEFVARKKPYMSILPELILGVDSLK